METFTLLQADPWPPRRVLRPARCTGTTLSMTSLSEMIPTDHPFFSAGGLMAAAAGAASCTFLRHHPFEKYLPAFDRLHYTSSLCRQTHGCRGGGCAPRDAQALRSPWLQG